MNEVYKLDITIDRLVVYDDHLDMMRTYELTGSIMGERFTSMERVDYRVYSGSEDDYIARLLRMFTNGIFKEKSRMIIANSRRDALSKVAGYHSIGQDKRRM